jgi:hypothetical protein
MVGPSFAVDNWVRVVGRGNGDRRRHIGEMDLGRTNVWDKGWRVSYAHDGHTLDLHDYTWVYQILDMGLNMGFGWVWGELYWSKSL